MTTIYSLYKITNSVNDKIYCGVHREDLWSKLDSYLGSGTPLNRSIKKHGKEKFKREIMCASDSLEEKMRKKEIQNG